MPLSPRMKWKISRYGRQMDERLERARGFFRTVWSQQRMCPACRALVDRKEKKCPMCGEPLKEVASAGLGRMVDLILPDQGRISMLLLGANVFVFALTWVASRQANTGEFSFGNLLGSIDGYTLVRFGAKSPLMLAGEWWRLVTAIFLHGGVLHLAMNSWVLFDLGPAVEAIYGRQKFLVLYVVSGIASFAASLLWRPYGISVGASGAIFGLIGVMIAYGYRHRSGASDSVKNMFMRWAIYGLIFGFLVPGIDNAAHIGGLIAGALFGWAVPDLPSLTQPTIYFWKVLQGLSIAAILLCFVMVALHQPQPLSFTLP